MRTHLPGRRAAALLIGGLSLLAAPALASADTFPWSSWHLCDTSWGSNKRVRMQWDSATSAVKPYRVEWKTDTPGIPLRPTRRYHVGFGPTPHGDSSETLPASYASLSWYLRQGDFSWISKSRNPYVVVDLYESNGNRSCSSTITF